MGHAQSWLGTYSTARRGSDYVAQATFLTYDQPLYYGLMAWGGVETYASSSAVSYGMSFASMACSIPWMVIEQQV